jgi:hypothetical protein
MKRANDRHPRHADRVPADHRHDRLVDVDDVEVARAQLAAQRADGAWRDRNVRDGAVGVEADCPSQRHDVVRKWPRFWARTAVQPARETVVGVVGREHADLVPAHQELLRERLDVPRHSAWIRPRIGRNQSDPHPRRL